MATIKEQCNLRCPSHSLNCELPQSHEGYCACKRCNSPAHQKKRTLSALVEEKLQQAAELRACITKFQRGS